MPSWLSADPYSARETEVYIFYIKISQKALAYIADFRQVPTLLLQ